MTRRKGPADPYADEREELAHYYRNNPPPKKGQSNQYPNPIGPENPRAGANPKQYAQPIGPRQNDPNQYRSPIGPVHPHSSADRKQYRQPIGPEHPRADANPKQYKTPIGPEHPRKDANPNQYSAPIGPRQQSAFDRIRSAGRTAYDAGAQVRSTIDDIGQSTAIRGIASQSGFSSQSPRVGYHRANEPVNYPDENPNNERIYMTICDSQGNCKQKTIKGAPRRKRQPRGPTWGAGGLGSFGNDPGFL